MLEIDNDPVIEQKLQNLTVTIRNYFKEKNIRITNFKLSNQTLSFTSDENSKQTILDAQGDNKGITACIPYGQKEG